MAICAMSHALPDGTVVVALDTVNTELTACQMVVITGSEFQNSLMNFGQNDALQLSGVICLIWATAWIFKQIIRSVNEKSGETNED